MLRGRQLHERGDGGGAPEFPEALSSTPGFRCRYCGTLNDVDAKHCISCDAVL